MILKAFEKDLATFGYFIKNNIIVDVFGKTVGSMNNNNGFDTVNSRFQQTILKLMGEAS
tara:strand:+ start:695 stop:871 length:177 start_codon:yes stop_codon:yes gene_type:complete